MGIYKKNLMDVEMNYLIYSNFRNKVAVWSCGIVCLAWLYETQMNQLPLTSAMQMICKLVYCMLYISLGMNGNLDYDSRCVL